MVVYFLKNKTNNKIYIGATRRDYMQRVRAHLGRYHMKTSLLSQDVDRCGRDNFEYGILRRCSSLEELKETEILEINKIPEFMRYNRRPQGVGKLSKTRANNIRKARLGTTLSEETKNKISASKKGVPWAKSKDRSYLKKLQEISAQKRSKRIKCNENNKVYKNSAEAAKDLGLCVSSPRDVAAGRRRQSKGYTFKYV